MEQITQSQRRLFQFKCWFDKTFLLFSELFERLKRAARLFSWTSVSDFKALFVLARANLTDVESKLFEDDE